MGCGSPAGALPVTRHLGPGGSPIAAIQHLATFGFRALKQLAEKIPPDQWTWDAVAQLAPVRPRERLAALVSPSA